jgi:hypothetical protein
MARTEEEAIVRLLTVQMGGQKYELPTLTLKQSKAWYAEVAHQTAIMEPPDQGDDAAAILGLMGASNSATLALIVAYDTSNQLGGTEAIENRMSQREAKAAFEEMLNAELPFEGAVPSVVEVFGAPGRALAAGLMLTMARALFPQASLPSGLSPTGDSTTPGTSGPTGPSSSSSSTGDTARNGSRAKLASVPRRRSSP